MKHLEDNYTLNKMKAADELYEALKAIELILSVECDVLEVARIAKTLTEKHKDLFEK